MPNIDALFTTVENYDKITIEYLQVRFFTLLSSVLANVFLQFSKIGKVMRHIAVLSDEKVPRNAEFQFKERADALVKKWQQILNANKPNGAAAESVSAGPISAAPTQEVGTMPSTAAINLNGKSTDGECFQLSSDW
jgi:hypothetical protein